jgi:DNA-binding MarR family transcriptional regulator
LLAIKGHPDPAGPTIGAIADYLVLRHHSTSELIARAAAAGLVTRNPDPNNGSAVRVTLTKAGAKKLNSLSAAHLDELAHLAPILLDALNDHARKRSGEQPRARPGGNRERSGRRIDGRR